MAVYVDNWEQRADVPNGNHVVRGKWSHMVADTHEELVALAQKIGLRPSWIQHEGTVHEHFDVTLSKKREAVAAGAIAIGWHQMGQVFEAKRLGTPIPTFEQEGTLL